MICNICGNDETPDNNKARYCQENIRYCKEWIKHILSVDYVYIKNMILIANDHLSDQDAPIFKKEIQKYLMLK